MPLCQFSEFVLGAQIYGTFIGFINFVFRRDLNLRVVEILSYQFIMEEIE